MPALLVELSDGQSRQTKVVGQEHQPPRVLGVVEAHTPQLVGVIFCGVESLQCDDLIAAQSGAQIDGLRVNSAIAQRFFGAHDKPGARLFDGVEPAEIDIAAIHQIERTGLVEELIEPKHFLVRGQTDQYLRGQMRVHFQLSVDLQTRTLGIEARPGVNRQTQVDNTGIQRINRLVQVQSQGFVEVKLSRLSDQQLGHIGEDAPVPSRQSIGQGAATNRSAQAQMVKLLGSRVQTRFDIAQTFAPSQLSKDQADELLPTGEVLDLVVAIVALNATMKLLPMKQIQKLGEHKMAGVHDSRIDAEPGYVAKPISNRSHLLKSSFAA
jgi:hypothetical protein